MALLPTALVAGLLAAAVPATAAVPAAALTVGVRVAVVLADPVPAA
ncbi:hypothetical protein O7606_16455 [Micromonospora sp. WMMD882]|nr:hypothetical protein [Micromonospora sp. WMMD882]WBB77857.1 hypothetical protein O7606_16455 [Micromonospora sp. WMMD882]